MPCTIKLQADILQQRSQACSLSCYLRKMGNQSLHRNDNDPITSLRHKVVATQKQKSEQENSQGNSGRSMQAPQGPTKRVGKPGARPRELTVFFSPSASSAHDNLSGIAVRWKINQQSPRRSASRSNAFYLTTTNDLISDLVAQNVPRVYKGILIDASKSSASQRDRLFSLWSQSMAGASATPYLASKSLRVIRRVLEAQRNGDGEAVIAEAFAEGRVLIVRDANLKIHRIDADQHPILSRFSSRQLLSFRLDSAGSGLHWHDLDLDLDLDGLLLRGEQSMESFRKERGSALATWLDKYPSVLEKLSTEDRAAVASIAKGDADLLISLVDRLAESASMSADALLEELALIQRPPTLEAPLS